MIALIQMDPTSDDKNFISQTVTQGLGIWVIRSGEQDLNWLAAGNENLHVVTRVPWVRGSFHAFSCHANAASHSLQAAAHSGTPVADSIAN